MTSRRILFLVSAHNSLSQRAWIELTELRPRRDRRGRRLERRDGGRGPRARPRADRVPDAQEDHPGVDLVPAPLPGRASGPARRPRPVLAGLGGRARSADVGRDGAAGQRRRRRRRRLGHADVPGRAPAARAACTGTRCAGRRSRPSSRRSASSPTGAGPRAAGSRRRARDRARAPADDAGRPRDRLARGRHRHRPAQAPRGRGPPGRARRDRRHGVPPVRRPRGGRAARHAGRDRRPARRRDLPGHRGRRRLDHHAQAGRAPATVSSCRPRARSSRPASRSRPRAPRAGPRAGARRRDLPRDRLRGDAPRASGTCASTSTTAR